MDQHWKAQPRDRLGRWSRLGALLRTAGGFTHAYGEDRERTDGYAIAVRGHEYTILGRATASQIKAFGEKHRDVLAQPDRHLGAWYNREDATTYLDISETLDDGAAALDRAREQGEIAIFDLAAGKEIRTLAGDWQPTLDAARGTDLSDLSPEYVEVPKHGRFKFGSNAEIQRLAATYGERYPDRVSAPPTDYSPVTERAGKKVAAAYAIMEHAPHDPEVVEAYSALKRETLDQYRMLQEFGYEFDFYPSVDPYPNSPREAIFDLTANHKMYVYPTDEGFGTDEEFDPGDNPLLELVPGEMWSGRPVTYNDVFRAVHDVFGHGKEGVGFRARGEDNAYRQHLSMFSPTAAKAMASETRGQNSWLNYGPNGEQNRNAAIGDTIFADQKVGILPAWARDPDIHKKTRRSA